MVTMQLTAGPVGSLFGALVVGIQEREDCDADGAPMLRAYLHAYYRKMYVLLGGEAADQMRQAWGATHSTHLYVRFTPDEVPRFQEPSGYPRAELVEA